MAQRSADGLYGLALIMEDIVDGGKSRSKDESTVCVEGGGAIWNT